MNKKVAFVFFATLTLVGVEMGQYEDNSVIVLDHMQDLRAQAPYASEECVIVAANIKAGNYHEIEHMMPMYGRCATRLVGLNIRVHYNDEVTYGN